MNDNGIKVKLVKDAVGGYRLVTIDDEIFNNLFVKYVERVAGSVSRVMVETVCILPDESKKNW